MDLKQQQKESTKGRRETNHTHLQSFKVAFNGLVEREEAAAATSTTTTTSAATATTTTTSTTTAAASTPPT